VRSQRPGQRMSKAHTTYDQFLHFWPVYWCLRGKIQLLKRNNSEGATTPRLLLKPGGFPWAKRLKRFAFKWQPISCRFPRHTGATALKADGLPGHCAGSNFERKQITIIHDQTHWKLTMYEHGRFHLSRCPCSVAAAASQVTMIWNRRRQPSKLRQSWGTVK